MPTKAKISKLLSLPEQIAKQLRERIILNRSPGDRLPTVIELAGQFGVSKHSITNALEILARSGVINKRQGCGVYVAEKKPRLRVGILSELNLLDARTGHYLRAVAGEVKSQLEAAGVETRLYVGNAIPGPGKSDTPTCPQFWDDMAAGLLDGAVLLDVPSSEVWGERCRSCSIPTVGDWSGYEVRIDSEGVIRAALRRLAGLGCQKVGLISWLADIEPFRQGVRECGLTTDAAWIRNDIEPVFRGAGWDEFCEIWTSGKRPDGLVILDDMLFMDVQLALTELGVKVPRDLQLVVQTNRGISNHIRVPVTAMEINPGEEAAAYVEFLMRRMRGESFGPITRKLSFREIPMNNGVSVARLRTGEVEVGVSQPSVPL